MQKLSAYNLAQNNNCGLITCSICGRSYRITEFGTDADCQSNSPSASVPNFCPYCASPFERPLTRVRKQEIEDYILDTIRIGMKSDTVLDPETVIDFLCNISDGGFELYDPKFEIYFNSGITYGADNLELLHVTKHEIDLTVQRGGVIFQDVLKDWSIEPDATIHVWRFSESESDVMTSEFSLFMLGLLAKSNNRKDELMEENEKRRNVELAYLSLMLSGKKVSECELASEVLKISRAKGEKSLAMLVQSSIKITVKVLSVVLEESSKRYVITFRQLGEDSDETIRSERTDGRRGKYVMQLWGRDLKNHICILFKHNEESKDPSKSGGFRVAPYVIDLGLQKN